jgi:hypothetical protein
MSTTINRAHKHYLHQNVLVIPCYNEEKRLSAPLVHALADSARMTILLVDDGSTDGTAQLLSSLVEAGDGRILALALPKNGGKAEAVRQGIRWAIDRGAIRIGYTDADFATPPPEVLRLLDALDHQNLGAVLGCRVARIGAHIERHTTRHLMSRLFAAIASKALRVTVYDTQCGAKWFRANAALDAAVSTPFHANWSFDVELLGRLMGRWGSGPRIEDDDLLEIPIRAWRDVDGSKVQFRGMLRALWDLVQMARLSARLGPTHTAALEVVPFQRPVVPDPRNSWLPSSIPAPLPRRVSSPQMAAVRPSGPVGSGSGTHAAVPTIPTAANGASISGAVRRSSGTALVAPGALPPSRVPTGLEPVEPGPGPTLVHTSSPPEAGR